MITQAIIVATGGRNYIDRHTVYLELDRLAHVRVLVHGACPVGGADWLCHDWAQERGVPILPFPPDPRNDKARFAIRNIAMVQWAIDLEATMYDTRALCVAFRGDRGTEMTVKIARDHNMQIWRPDSGLVPDWAAKPGARGAP